MNLRTSSVLKLIHRTTDIPPGLPPGQKGHEFYIDLEDTTTLVQKPIYKLSPLELEEAKKQIDLHARAYGYIKPSGSPYGSPSPLCTEEGWRPLDSALITGGLNKKTIRNRYPLLLPEELFDRLGDSNGV